MTSHLSRWVPGLWELTFNKLLQNDAEYLLHKTTNHATNNNNYNNYILFNINSKILFETTQLYGSKLYAESFFLYSPASKISFSWFDDGCMLIARHCSKTIFQSSCYIQVLILIVMATCHFVMYGIFDFGWSSFFIFFPQHNVEGLLVFWP